MEWLFAVGFAVLILAWRFRHVFADLLNKRDQAMREFAATRGWTYQSSGAALVLSWTGQPFEAGDNRRAKHVLRGTHRGRKIIAFDYFYDQRFGRTKETYRHSVVAIELPGVLPLLEVSYEGPMGGVVGETLGLGDLQFEHDGFNQTFRVRAANPRYGHAVIHPRMMELLIAAGDIAWRIEGNSIVGWSRGAHEPAEIVRGLTLLDQVADLIPPFVWRDHAGIDPRGDGLAPRSG
jgi:hypothetical protein